MIEVTGMKLLSEGVGYDKAGKHPSAFVLFIGAIVCILHLNSLRSMLVQVYGLCDLPGRSHH